MSESRVYIVVQVKNAHQAHIQNARVILTHLASKREYQRDTDERGVARFGRTQPPYYDQASILEVLPEGEYEAKATKVGGGASSGPVGSRFGPKRGTIKHGRGPWIPTLLLDPSARPQPVPPLPKPPETPATKSFY